jgi:RNA polymerase sigma-70 factor (ECF subfamily)
MDGRTRSLCKRAKKGSKDAACELLGMCYADIFAYLRRLCGSQQDAEDLTQETFLKVWSSLSSFKGRSSFSTWLHRIAYNTYIDWQRRRPTQIQSTSDESWQEWTDNNPDPFANAAEQQTAKRLYEAVDKLDDGKKHVVHLHYYQGLSLRETAKVLHISTSTVKYRLREVIKTLRDQICVEESVFNQQDKIPIPKGEPI